MMLFPPWLRKSFLLLLVIFGLSLLLSVGVANILTDSQSKSVDISTRVKSKPITLGMNSGVLDSWSSEVALIDAFRTSRNWMPKMKNVLQTQESAQLDLDENGWVKSMKNSSGSSQYTAITTIMYNGFDGHYPGGQYLVLYEGEGKIVYQGDGKKDEQASTPGRDVLNVTPSRKGIRLSITSTDPQHKGNYIRNIRVIPKSYESTYAQEIFNPDFLKVIKPFDSFRFMNWMKTNNSIQREWSDRPTLNSARWSQLGAPVEVMVELANRLDLDPWFCMPHQATDDYVTRFATYVRDHLEPERKVYVEYSNEVWNGQFRQFKWVQNQSESDPSTKDWVDWFSKRTTQITRIWDQVFGAQKDRVIGVMAAQAASLWTGETALKYRWSKESHSHDYYGIDAIAIAPYFGGYLGREKYESIVQNWTLEQIFQEINEGIIKDDKIRGGALKQAYKNIESYSSLAKKEGLLLLAYEGGQHLAASRRVNRNNQINNLFIGANRDSRMGGVYKKYLNHWHQSGGELFMHYNDISKPNKWGSWGALEYVTQDNAPKYNALMEIIKSSSSSSR